MIKACECYCCFMQLQHTLLSDNMCDCLLHSNMKLARGRSSLLPSLIGILVGAAHSRFAFLRRMAMPRSVSNLFGMTLGRIINLGVDTNSGDASGHAGRMSGREWPTSNQPATNLNPMQNAPTYAAMAAGPPEELVARLEAMGFGRQECLDALRRSNNDIARAAEMLLTAS